MESFVRSGQLPVSVLLPTPAPAFSDKVCKVGSPPIGGPGWEHDITPPTVRIPLRPRMQDAGPVMHFSATR